MIYNIYINNCVIIIVYFICIRICIYIYIKLKNIKIYFILNNFKIHHVLQFLYDIKITEIEKRDHVEDDIKHFHHNNIYNLMYDNKDIIIFNCFLIFFQILLILIHRITNVTDTSKNVHCDKNNNFVLLNKYNKINKITKTFNGFNFHRINTAQ